MRTARAQQPPFRGLKAVCRVPLRALGLVLCRCQRRVIPGDCSRAGARRSLITAVISQVVEACSAAPRMIQARPGVSLELVVVVVVSGGEESREELGEGVRRDWSLLRLWRGRWMVISRVREICGR